jgi:hypothetical protein
LETRQPTAARIPMPAASLQGDGMKIATATTSAASLQGDGMKIATATTCVSPFLPVDQ